MKITALLCAGALSIASASALGSQSCGPQRVAFTFDDPPLPDTVVMTGAERTARIIEALEGGDVEGAMFFSVSSRIDDETITRMQDYAAAGHVIASHTHTHANLHNVGSEAFTANIAQADEVLSALPGFAPYFRFPYLNEGSSVAERDAVRAYLAELGYRPGYVTIDNYDFYIDRLLREAKESGLVIDMAGAANLYVEMIMGAARHYDAIACQWLGRSPAHVLLLHENDAAALFLPELITAFRDKGWAIIPALEAYKDPIAEVVPDTLVLGQGQVAALAAVAGADPKQLRHEGEDTEVLQLRFESVIETTE